MSRRTQKVSSSLQYELANLILTEVSDPALQGITLTDLQLTNDLKKANVYFTTHGDPKVKMSEIKKGFKRATPFLRHALGKRLQLRSVPELDFTPDTHNDEVVRVMQLLNEVATNKGSNEVVL